MALNPQNKLDIEGSCEPTEIRSYLMKINFKFFSRKEYKSKVFKQHGKRAPTTGLSPQHHQGQPWWGSGVGKIKMIKSPYEMEK